MIGFHVPSPLDRINHYEYPDEGWQVTVRPSGRGTRYDNRHAQAFFGQHSKNGFYDANEFIDHPGDIAIFARLHLILDPRSERFVLNSQEVQALLGGEE
jgi:hypothetical protein